MLSLCYIMNCVTGTQMSHSTVYFMNMDRLEHCYHTEYSQTCTQTTVSSSIHLRLKDVELAVDWTGFHVGYFKF